MGERGELSDMLEELRKIRVLVEKMAAWEQVMTVRIVALEEDAARERAPARRNSGEKRSVPGRR